MFEVIEPASKEDYSTEDHSNYDLFEKRLSDGLLSHSTNDGGIIPFINIDPDGIMEHLDSQLGFGDLEWWVSAVADGTATSYDYVSRHGYLLMGAIYADHPTKGRQVRYVRNEPIEDGWPTMSLNSIEAPYPLYSLDEIWGRLDAEIVIRPTEEIACELSDQSVLPGVHTSFPQIVGAAGLVDLTPLRNRSVIIDGSYSGFDESTVSLLINRIREVSPAGVRTVYQ